MKIAKEEELENEEELVSKVLDKEDAFVKSSLLEMFHYYNIAALASRQFNIGMHSDFTLLTLIPFANGDAGLEVFSAGEGWISVEKK